ncbi:MAG TPA: M23 family metallopeptidase [Cyclobacteriaceae bacterium]|nr:M23 family metallopeptidase [Cyclobacteriaceae bacterium]
MQFRFNPKTLRYERVRFSIWRAFVSVLSYGFFGFLFFVGLNLLQNILIETKVEKSLAKENEALKEYKTILTSQLSTSNTLLAELKTEETRLNEKLFEVPAEITSTEPKNVNQHLASGDGSFDEQVSSIGQNLDLLNTKTKKQNQFFGDHLHLQKTDMSDLISLPTISPVKNISEENLVSGFGVRINPFHKGNYHHDGIDIALPKGSEVRAAGNGRVSYFSNSTMAAGFGNYIELDHGNGVLTRYTHLEKISVTWGQKITQGQVIGLSGSSGGSVAPHLHYEVIKNGKNQNPITYIVEEITPIQHQQLALKSKIQNQSLD